MENKYLRARSDIKNGKIVYSSFELIDNGRIKKRFSPKSDEKIVEAMKEFNIRPTGSVKDHKAFIKKELFVDYVDKHLFPNKKKKKNNIIFNPRLWAFITTSTILATIALNNRNADVSANENNTAITTTTEATTEEEKQIAEDIVPVKEDKIEIIESIDNSSKETVFDENKIDTNMVYSSNFEDIFQYSAENLYGDYSEYIEEHYGQALDLYCPMYGMDKNLAIAIISQENPLNKPNTYSIIDEDLQLRDGGYGPGQEEHVHNGELLYCKNLITNETDYVKDFAGYNKNNEPMYGVDVKRCETDTDYAIKVFIMRFMYNTNYLYNKNNFELSDSEFIDITIDAYNKGVYGTEESILKSYSYEDVIEHNKNLAGDINYRYNIYRYIKDGTPISITTSDGVVHTAIFDNTNVNEYQVNESKEIKTMAR